MSDEVKEVMSPERERMSLAELTEEADVSVRTVRYYIGEGLLPPPEGAGPGSAYGQGHLDRLRLIQRLKTAYLPLKEIRRRLAGLSDDDVRRVLAAEEERMPVAREESAAYDASLASARDYLSLLEPRARYYTEPLDLRLPSSPLGAAQPAAASGPEIAPDAARARGPRPAGVVHARREPAREPAETAAEGLWHRIALGDEAELVISERVYARHRDRVDWLVRWARKVFA
jgi:DNA-binding transcriptional MerR regulator